MHIAKKILAILLIYIPINLFSQEIPLEVYLGIGFQNIFADKFEDNSIYGYQTPSTENLNGLEKLSDGYGFNAEFRYIISRDFRISFDVGFDNQVLLQDNVLDEWEWRYWEDRYIDFIPGINADEANKTLRYNSGDGLYSAVFEPKQKLKELKFSTTLSNLIDISDRLILVPSLQLGVNIYTRELEMREEWIKRFDLDGNDTLDYSYEFDLLHFAPEKKGTRFFAAPGLGIKYLLGENYDLEFDFKYFQYMQRKQVKFIEELFNVSKNSDKWFPLYSKYQIRIGIVFKY